MIQRISVFTAAAMAALSLSACGDRTAAPGVGPGPSSVEPIDAVPLPLDALQPTPAETAPAAPADVAKPAAAEDATTSAEATTGPAAAPPTSSPALALDPSPKTPRVVVPREPSRPIDRPNDGPVPDPAPASDGDKPVLTF